MNNTKTSLGFRRSAGVAVVTLAASLLVPAPKASATDSGLGFYPTADIYGKGNWHFDVDTLGAGVKTNGFTSVGLEYGFGPDKDGIFGRSEFGFDYTTSPFGASANKRIALNFKTQLYNDDKAGTRIAIGVSNVGDKALGNTNTHLLGYKSFDFGRVHAGVHHSLGRNGAKDTTSLQLGYDKSVGNGIILGADWRSGKAGFLAPCVIWNINDKAGFEIAIGRANSKTVAPRWQTYLAFDYNFDFKKP